MIYSDLGWAFVLVHLYVSALSQKVRSFFISDALSQTAGGGRDRPPPSTLLAAQAAVSGPRRVASPCLSLSAVSRPRRQPRWGP